MDAEIEKSQLPDFPLTKQEEDEVVKLAAVGFMARDIAVTMEWPPERRAQFCALALFPGSTVATLISIGRSNGRAAPQIKLQEQAKDGNIDAIKTLQKLQALNRFNELVTYMDDDELAT